MIRPALAAGPMALAIALSVVPWGRAVDAQEVPSYLRDRGTGVRTSLFGSYVRQGELLVYPFFEWYADANLEYKPSELGHGPSVVDYRGRYRASEGILFLGYGVAPDLALEFEAAVITASIEKAANDTSSGPRRVEESGLGDVEGQIRWRFQRETASRPELFTYVGAVFPLQKSRRIIGTQNWEFFFGAGITRGFSWGTLTLRAAAEYLPSERPRLDGGEYAFEYLRQFSPAWRLVTGIEGNQIDEVSLITELQWHLSSHAILKLNNAWGLTPNAVDVAPEVGFMFAF